MRFLLPQDKNQNVSVIVELHFSRTEINKQGCDWLYLGLQMKMHENKSKYNPRFVLDEKVKRLHNYCMRKIKFYIRNSSTDVQVPFSEANLVQSVFSVGTAQYSCI